MDKELEIQFNALHDHLNKIQRMVGRMAGEIENLSDTLMAEIRLMTKDDDEPSDR